MTRWSDEPRMRMTRKLAPDALVLPEPLAIELAGAWRSLLDDHEEGWGPRKQSPRPAPRRVFAAAAAQLGSSIPVWVPAFWSCRVYTFGFSDIPRVLLAVHLSKMNQDAHGVGAPPSLRFFASFHPSTPARSVYLGFEAAPVDAPNPSPLVEFSPGAKDPERRLKRMTPLEWLAGLERVDLESGDLDELPLPSRRRAGPLRIPWEDETEPISPTPLSGQRVTHPKFGYGTILREDGEGKYAAFEVRFDDTVTRRVWPKSVKLLDS